MKDSRMVVDEGLPVGVKRSRRVQPVTPALPVTGVVELPPGVGIPSAAVPGIAAVGLDSVRLNTGGRRELDDTVVAIVRGTLPVLFWIFGLFLEPKPPHKPSISRISWFLIVLAGLAMFGHEILLTQCAKVPTVNTGTPAGAQAWLFWARTVGECGVAISNAAWQAWAVAFGACSVAVFGPRVADYWKNGAAAALGTIATAVRDPREPSRNDDERVDR